MYICMYPRWSLPRYTYFELREVVKGNEDLENVYVSGNSFLVQRLRVRRTVGPNTRFAEKTSSGNTRWTKCDEIWCLVLFENAESICEGCRSFGGTTKVPK